MAALAGETWIAGEGAAGEPRFRAWPTLADPIIGHVVGGWPARLGLVAAGVLSRSLPRCHRGPVAPRLSGAQHPSREHATAEEPLVLDGGVPAGEFTGVYVADAVFVNGSNDTSSDVEQ